MTDSYSLYDVEHESVKIFYFLPVEILLNFSKCLLSKIRLEGLPLKFSFAHTKQVYSYSARNGEYEYALISKMYRLFTKYSQVKNLRCLLWSLEGLKTHGPLER